MLNCTKYLSNTRFLNGILLKGAAFFFFALADDQCFSCLGKKKNNQIGLFLCFVYCFPKPWKKNLFCYGLGYNSRSVIS